MKTAVVIIDGIRFPYFLADHAVAWAKQEGGALHALFLTAGKEVPEGYVFPSDIDQAEMLRTTKDAEKDTATIINDQMKLFADMAIGEDIPVQTEWLRDPTIELVLEKAEGADRIFIAPGYGDFALLAVTRFRLEALAGKSPCPVETVEEKG